MRIDGAALLLQFFQNAGGAHADRAAHAYRFSGVDVIVHLASSTVPATASEDPVQDAQTNLVGTLRLLQAMQTSDANKVATPEGWTPGCDVIVPPPKTADELAKRAGEGYNTVAWYYSTKPL